MSSAAQLGETPNGYESTGTEGGGALKQLAAERVAAHRNRRAVVEVREAQARREQAEAQAMIRAQARREAARTDGQTDASRVREAVAARYQQSLSYREFLAAESQRALDKARAEAEVAARNAKALAEAQRVLLEEMEQWHAPAVDAGEGELFEELPLLEIVEAREENSAGSVRVEGPRESTRARKVLREEASFDFLSELPEARFATPSAARFSAADLRVRLHEEVELARAVDTVCVPSTRVPMAADEMAELDEEIEFRCAPEFEDLVMETQVIPANIIQFPRELVASRKARPRLAEGPLRADGTPEPQLRIFEVEQAQISVEPEVVAPEEAPEWQGMMLGAGAASKVSMSPQLEAQLQLDQQLFAAPVQRRMLSAALDALCVVAGFTGFVAVAVKIAGPVLRVGLDGVSRPVLAGGVVGTLMMFAVMYQLLFFTLNDATLGMRVTRIAFCNFNEKSPTRKALRRRLVSTALAACPLGLGLVWMMLDGDRLGWHDRMSRMYPREY